MCVYMYIYKITCVYMYIHYYYIYMWHDGPVYIYTCMYRLQVTERKGPSVNTRDCSANEDNF